MPVGHRDSYFIRGAHPHFAGPSLEEAIVDLVDYWNTEAPLRKNGIGNLVVEIQIGSTAVTVEVTDPIVLDDMRIVGAKALFDYLADSMGMPRKDAVSLLEEASGAVTVDVIRDPNNIDAWKPGIHPIRGEGAESAADVLPTASADLLKAAIREQDAELRRAPGRPRTGEAKKLLESAVRMGKTQRLSNAELSRRTGIPRSTLRDARRRMARAEAIKKAPKTLRVHKPRQRLTPRQEKLVLAELSRQEGNAAAASRATGIPARTIRDIRARAAAPAPRAPRPKGGWTEAQREALIERVKTEDITASQAAREAGIPPRTARGWVRKAKLG